MYLKLFIVNKINCKLFFPQCFIYNISEIEETHSPLILQMGSDLIVVEVKLTIYMKFKKKKNHCNINEI